MIAAKNFKRQPGGLYTAVWACDQTDNDQRDALEGVLGTIIRHEAKVHGADFDPIAFRNVMRALQLGNAEILFLAAAWDLTKPKIVGATINFRSLFLQRDGQDISANNGIYSEDVCLLPSKIRELVSEWPTGGEFPNEGLGVHFIRKCIQHFAEKGMKDGIKPAGQRFEFLPNNTKIIKIQEQLGAVLGADFKNSGLLRFDGITDIIRDKWVMPVELLNVRSADGGIDPHNFLLRWEGQNERQKIHAGFTRGVGTFAGSSVSQSQIVSSGELPDTPVVECALASILKAANDEIQERNWGRVDYWSPHNGDFSGLLIGDAQRVFGEMPVANDDEILVPSLSAAEKVFGVQPPPIYVHALMEPKIVAGLESLGLEKRILGHSPSQTASLNLVEASENKYPVRPLNLVGSKAANDPVFSLDAA